MKQVVKQNTDISGITVKKEKTVNKNIGLNSPETKMSRSQLRHHKNKKFEDHKENKVKKMIGDYEDENT